MATLIFMGGFAIALTLYTFFFLGRRSKNMPDGPRTLPLIGNLHQMPKKGAHFKFTAWARKYGGLYSLKLGTGTAIVLTDPRLVKQLVDKKSSIYSSRPNSYVADLITGGDHLLVMKYGNMWRSFRKIIHQHFMESMVEKEHIQLQNAEAVQMMKDFATNPEQHMLHPKRYSNSIIMSLLFGVRTPSWKTSHMQRLYDLMENWSKVMETGATPPVDIFSFLHYVPESVFGNWRTRATNVQQEMSKLYDDMLQHVIKRREASGSKGSFLDIVLDQNDKLGLNNHQLYFLGGVMMEGGSDTSSSIIISFVQAITKWQEVQKKAQIEIDAIVGEDRSPVWSDYEKLPYVAATVKEAMRWRPVVPLAFPHALSEDDWVDGKFLPKGSMVIINAWGMQHDPKKFKSPEVFDPDHYTSYGMALAPELAASADYEKRDHWGYGSGRRLCPGIHLAERNLFLAMAKLLWAFSSKPGKNEAKKTVEPDTDPITGYSEGFLVCANDFLCDIEPRSEARRTTIMREFAEAETNVFGKYEQGA